MSKQKILHLTLKKKWFDMIASGEKREEYREIKPYWERRLIEDYKEFDVVRFRNGYAKNSPTMDVECRGISVDYGLMTWGAEKDTKYFIISLGNIISTPQPFI